MNDNVKYGFWVGLGVLLAVALWSLVSRLLHGAVSRSDG